MKTEHRLGARAALLALGTVLVLSTTHTARAQSGVGVGFPIQTMPSPGAPSAMPAPAQPSSSLLPPGAAPSPPPAEKEPEKQLEEEQPEPRFGHRGQIVISGQLSASIGFLSYDQSPASSSSASFEPSFDYFFADRWLVGGSLFMRYAGGTSGIGIKSTTYTFGGSVRFGTNLPLGKVLSFEPVANVAFWQAQTSFDASGGDGYVSVGGAAVPVGGEVDENVVAVGLYAPLLVHPAAHFFLGLGPDFYRDLTHSIDAASFSNTRRTFIGVSSTVGGWF